MHARRHRGDHAGSVEGSAHSFAALSKSRVWWFGAPCSPGNTSEWVNSVLTYLRIEWMNEWTLHAWACSTGMTLCSTHMLAGHLPHQCTSWLPIGLGSNGQ